MKKVKVEKAKKVPTFDLEGKENGFLIELFKKGKKTIAYLSATKSGGFKGYHYHKIRAARYICIKGRMKIILYVNGRREEHILSADNPERLFVPPRIPTGLLNIGKEEGWLINYPHPAYDPSLKGEQVEFIEEELEKAS